MLFDYSTHIKRTGRYRGCYFEVNLNGWNLEELEKMLKAMILGGAGFNCPEPGKLSWSGYLILPRMQIGDDLWRKFIPGITDPSDVSRRQFWKIQDSPLANLDGWNGGATYFGIEGDNALGHPAIKVGHDYGHSWDAEGWNTWNSCANDLRVVIGSLRERHPGIPCHCGGNGNWYREQEMEVMDGKLSGYSKEYRAEQKKLQEEREQKEQEKSDGDD